MSDSERFAEACLLACDLHRKQFRKDARADIRLPYMFHIMEVTKTLWDWGVRCPNTLIAAVMHDILEDCRDIFTLADLEKECGSAVAQIVQELTFLEGDKNEYLNSFANKSIESLVIKVADRYCNVFDFFHGGDKKYAKKYLGKATVLLELVEVRDQEVIDKFGQEVADNINHGIAHLFKTFPGLRSKIE
jgi:(p)ppGpp synthase/HD superfamily hydrolase